MTAKPDWQIGIEPTDEERDEAEARFRKAKDDLESIDEVLTELFGSPPLGSGETPRVTTCPACGWPKARLVETCDQPHGRGWPR